MQYTETRIDRYNHKHNDVIETESVGEIYWVENGGKKLISIIRPNQSTSVQEYKGIDAEFRDFYFRHVVPKVFLKYDQWLLDEFLEFIQSKLKIEK